MVAKKTQAKASPKQIQAFSIVEDEASDAARNTFSKKKREQVLRAAIETFLELGYEGASMNLVAERAGVIKQTIYSHFKDKEGLFVSAINAITIGHVEDVLAGDIASQMPPQEVMRKLAQTLCDKHQDPIFVKLQRTIMGESGRFPQIAELFTKATIKPGLALLTDYLREHPQIDCPDPEAFARTFIGTFVHYSIQQNILNGRELLPFASERLVDEMMRIFEAACMKRD